MWSQLNPQQAWRLFYHHFVIALKTFNHWDYLGSAVKRVSLNKVRIIATTILPVFHLLVLVFYGLQDLSLWAWELWIYKTHGMILLHVSSVKTFMHTQNTVNCKAVDHDSCKVWLEESTENTLLQIGHSAENDSFHIRHLNILGVVLYHAWFIFHSSPYKFLSNSGIPMLMFWLSFWVPTGRVQMVPSNRSILGVC